MRDLIKKILRESFINKTGDLVGFNYELADGESKFDMLTDDIYNNIGGGTIIYDDVFNYVIKDLKRLFFNRNELSKRDSIQVKFDDINKNGDMDDMYNFLYPLVDNLYHEYFRYNLNEETDKREPNQLDMMYYWKNSPKVTDPTDQQQMDDFMWYLIEYVDFPSDGNYRRIKPFIEGLLNYGLVDYDLYVKMYRWMVFKMRDLFKLMEEENLEDELTNVGGDDSYNDWAWHVLSLGRNRFEKALEMWDDDLEYILELKPIESFGYGWPHPLDIKERQES